MTPPQWVLDEVARREAEAREMYEKAVKSIPHWKDLVTEDEYVRRYLNDIPPITWTSGGAA